MATAAHHSITAHTRSARDQFTLKPFLTGGSHVCLAEQIRFYFNQDFNPQAGLLSMLEGVSYCMLNTEKDN